MEIEHKSIEIVNFKKKLKSWLKASFFTVIDDIEVQFVDLSYMIGQFIECGIFLQKKRRNRFWIVLFVSM